MRQFAVGVLTLTLGPLAACAAPVEHSDVALDRVDGARSTADALAVEDVVTPTDSADDAQDTDAVEVDADTLDDGSMDAVSFDAMDDVRRADAGRDVADARTVDARAGEPIPASRLALLEERVGYGRNARGGQGGTLCRVRTLANAGAGSLRECVTGDAPRWVIFDVSGTIALTDFLNVGSFKTIDGRGANITLSGRSLWLDAAQHVIVENITITNSVIPPGLTFGGDAFTIFDGAHDIWLDHVSASNSEDGLVDIVEGATDITISWSRFSNHSKVMLIGSSGTDTRTRNSRVTLHHNFFDRTVQRHPRLRHGTVHAFNNVLRQWQSYGMSSTWDAMLLSERNVFDASASEPRAIITTSVGDPEPRGNARSANDRLLNGATVEANNAARVLAPTYPYRADVADTALQTRVQSGAGWRNVTGL